MNYIFHVLIYVEIYVILALSLNVILGYCGMFSLAHSAFFAVGAYTYGILATRFGLGFIPAVVFAAMIGCAASVLLSLPSWRLRGDFFLMITLAAQAVIFSLIYNWHELGEPVGSLRNLTNGPYGLSNLPRPNLLGMEVQSQAGLAVLGLLCAGTIGLVLWRLKTSPWGRMLQAIRDDELVARSLGKNARLAKAEALGIGCGLATMAGVLYASYASYVDPSICSVDDSVLIMSAVVVGGMGAFWGPVLGAALIVAIPELLRFFALPQVVAANLRLALFGALLVVVIHVRPQGISGKLGVE